MACTETLLLAIPDSQFTGTGLPRTSSRKTGHSPNTEIEVRDLEFLVWRMQPVVGQTEPHQNRGNAPECREKSPTIGIDPPLRVNTVSRPKTSSNASAAKLDLPGDRGPHYRGWSRTQYPHLHAQTLGRVGRYKTFPMPHRFSPGPGKVPSGSSPLGGSRLAGITVFAPAPVKPPGNSMHFERRSRQVFFKNATARFSGSEWPCHLVAQVLTASLKGRAFQLASSAGAGSSTSS